MSTNTDPDDLEGHLRSLEESLLQPDIRKSNQLVALLADEFIEFGTSGRIYTKEDLVAVLQAESASVQTANNVKVALLAPTVALLTYFIRHEASPPGHTLRSSVWCKRQGGWQMIFHQSTRTTEEQLPK